MPALAAFQQPSHTAPLQIRPSGPADWLAEKSRDDDDKERKKKSEQQKKKQQHQKKPTQQSKPSGHRKLDDRNTKQPSSKQLNDKQRQKIYQEGRQKGYDKGREAGYDKGFDKGFDKGRKQGRDKAYREAQRKQWKSWNKDQWRYHNVNRRNIWINPVRYNRPFYGYPGWAQNPNWGYNRPWGGGWYNSGSPSWSWWGGQALGWGINALTTALIVNNAVNNAIRQRQPTVVVPNSSMQLYYGSVEPSADSDVTFVVANGGNTYQMEADCADGLLNGEVPTSLAEAELINAACQVAFGSI